MSAVDDGRSAFLGSFRLHGQENFDAYLKELGINPVLRKIAAITVPTLIFSADDEGLWTLRTETLVKNAIYKFRWGENSMQTTIDDRKLDTKYEMDKGEMVSWQRDKHGRNIRSGHKLRKEGDQEFLDIRMEVNGVVSNAVFKRIK